MYNKKECVAMLLAGGQGSRLYALTKNVAKPAVPYGGKYRIIDFPLSNCVNSGIDTVGVLTQYQPLVLNDYIGNGQAWNLDRIHGGVHILPPYQSSSGAQWYEGTANAIYQNLSFIDRYDPEYVVILSGDHIYKMDYSDMLSYHKKKNAACTIAVLNVEYEEASRFGIMSTDETGAITKFVEKPKEPESTLASMGIYIFSYPALKKYLIENEEDTSATKDFGKNIIPAMLAAKERMYAYSFEGYWKDVGTIDSLWEANMDLLSPSVTLDLYDPAWKIYSNNDSRAPQLIGSDAKVQNSMITTGCVIDGFVDFSVISGGVTIEEGAVVADSILMPGATVRKGAVVEYSIVGENSVIEAGAHIGARPESYENKSDWGVAVVGHDVTIGQGAVVAPKQIIDHDI
ncbi:MAG TPA: glucose-1-phosphate adenylyltransferase [Candidatus Faeciplasma avium]|uniref:Glucose-1-phosphate adenylyltransferase n=1 Tax=Candidatus Faeciplasma avium TaxID=2840798 RepID=A0A9D1T4E9_9FIRM|nr:glucose-1-phosphate adenylyltransferase [Candidatus Faeciplasma avium]